MGDLMARWFQNVGIGDNEGNKFKPDEFVPVNANYSVTAGHNHITVSKATNTAHNYGRAKANLANFGLVSGHTYKLTAEITDFSTSSLTGFIYIGDSGGNIIAQTTQLSTVHVGDSLEMTFTYNPASMVELSFYLNRGHGVSQNAYITYGNIRILRTA